MASYYGTNYTNIFETSPPVKVDVTDWHSRVRCMYDVYVLAAGSSLSVGDVLYLGRLPAGCKIVNAFLAYTAFGSTGAVELGYAPANGAVGTTSLSAFLGSTTISSAGTTAMSGAANASGFMALPAVAGASNGLAVESDVVATVLTATDTTGGTLKCVIEYVLD